MITVLFLIFIVFGFSLAFWMKLFNELDYYEIKYTKQTKKRTLWLIFGNLLSLIVLFYIVQSAFLRLQQ